MTSIRVLYDLASDWNAWLARVGDGRPAWEQARADASLGELEREYAGIEEARHVIAITDAASPEAAASLPLIARALEAAGGAAELRFLDRRADAEAIARALGVVPARSPLCLVYDEDWTECGRWVPRHARSANVPATGGDKRAQRAGGVQEVHTTVAGDKRAQRAGGVQEVYTAPGGAAQDLREFLAVLRGEPHETRHPWKTLTRHLWRQVDYARRE